MAWLSARFAVLLAVVMVSTSCAHRAAKPSGGAGGEYLLQINIGDDYLHAKQVLTDAGATDWSSRCGYLVISLDPDEQVTASYWALADGYNFTLRGSRRRTATGPAEEQSWRVAGMDVSDSTWLRSGKGESDFSLTKVVFKGGVSHLEGLPDRVLHLGLQREQARLRLEACGCQSIAVEPFDIRLNGPRDPTTQHIAPDESWQGFRGPEGTRLYMQFRRERSTEVLSRIVCCPAGAPESEGGGLLFRYWPSDLSVEPGLQNLEFEVFDPHNITIARYRSVMAPAIPKGWRCSWWKEPELDLRHEGDARDPAIVVKVLPPMSRAEYEQRRLSKDKLVARLAELEKEIDEFTVDGCIRVRNTNDAAKLSEEMRLRRQLEEIPDLLTSKAAICIVRRSSSADSELVAAAIRAALSRVD